MGRQPRRSLAQSAGQEDGLARRRRTQHRRCGRTNAGRAEARPTQGCARTPGVAQLDTSSRLQIRSGRGQRAVKAFFDTNILVYTTTSDAKKQRAAACLRRGGVASVQVLNEFVHVARRKLRHDWPQIEFALELFRDSLDDV